MNDKHSRNALTIIRVSTTDQARNGGSIEAQKEWIDRMVATHDLTVVKSIEDVFSGDNVAQKNFDEIMKIHETIGIDYVVVQLIDRLSRNFSYGSILLEKLNEKRKIKIITTYGIMNYENAQDKMMAGMQLVVAEMGQNTRRESIRSGIKIRLKKGEWPFIPPLGYYKDEENKLYPKSWCSEVINKMYDILQNTKRYQDVSRYINDKYNYEIGRKIFPAYVKVILSNPVYCGYLKWKDLKVGDGPDNRPFKHQVITEEKFNQVQDILKLMEPAYKKKKDTIIKDLIGEYGASALDLPFIKISCRKCGGSDLIHNGTELVQDFIQRKYYCLTCDAEFRIPGIKEIRRLKNNITLNCRKCGISHDFELIYDVPFWRLICSNCKNIILLYEYVDIHPSIKQDPIKKIPLGIKVPELKQIKMDNYINKDRC